MAEVFFVICTTMTLLGGGVFVWGVILMISRFQEVIADPVSAALMLVGWILLLAATLWMAAWAILMGFIVLEDPLKEFWLKSKGCWVSRLPRWHVKQGYGLV